MSYLFLASPYTDADPNVMQHRYYQAVAATHWLLKHRIWVYSPIVHCHPVATLFEHLPLPRDADYWRDYNRVMLLGSRGLMVLRIDGWRRSAGVRDEIDYTHSLGRPIQYMKARTSNSFRIIGEPIYARETA